MRTRWDSETVRGEALKRGSPLNCTRFCVMTRARVNHTGGRNDWLAQARVNGRRGVTHGKTNRGKTVARNTTGLKRDAGPGRPCCDPAGSHNDSQGTRYTGVSILREFGWHPVWRENSNAPDVRIATIDRIAGHMRRRSDDGRKRSVSTITPRDGCASQVLSSDMAAAGCGSMVGRHQTANT